MQFWPGWWWMSLWWWLGRRMECDNSPSAPTCPPMESYLITGSQALSYIWHRLLSIQFFFALLYFWPSFPSCNHSSCVSPHHMLPDVYSPRNLIPEPYLISGHGLIRAMPHMAAFCVVLTKQKLGSIGANKDLHTPLLCSLSFFCCFAEAKSSKCKPLKNTSLPRLCLIPLHLHLAFSLLCFNQISRRSVNWFWSNF